MKFRTFLKVNNLTQKIIRAHTQKDNVIVERAKREVRKKVEPYMVTKYEKAVKNI